MDSSQKIVEVRSQQGAGIPESGAGPVGKPEIQTKKALNGRDWWGALPEGERRLIVAIAQMLRSAKRSESREVARAARKWESGIGFFIKARLMNARRGRGGG
jgi:hypothetical protein